MLHRHVTYIHASSGRQLALLAALAVGLIINPAATNTAYAAGNFTAVSAGDRHTCAVTSSGGVKCWGLNNRGQLGNGGFGSSNVPVDVVGLTSGVIAVSAGTTHTCALTSSGGVKCWGLNESGQLGNGSFSDSAVPVDVSGLTSGVSAISAGNTHTCAVTSGGGVKCWGRNGMGKLGNGTLFGMSSVPVDVFGLSSGATGVSAGFEHTCAVVGGGVKCWGLNDFGQLGNGAFANATVPVDVAGLSSGATAVSAARFHTCALVSGGAKCWGDNQRGQLGNGSNTISNTPVDASGLVGGALDVSAGGEGSCALTSAGGVKCWGSNESGRLGAGTSGFGTDTNVPVDVVGLGSGMTAVSAGGGHSCALTSGGGIKCWGNYVDGQLGHGVSGYFSSVPVDVLWIPTDATPPVITPVVAGTLGNNDWYVSDVAVSWSVTDPDSAIISQTGCDPITINADTDSTTFTCATSSDGGTNTQSVTIKRDATAPAISASIAPVPNAAGWNNTDVMASFTCNDALSGIASCGPNQTLSGDGANQSASGTAVDQAGNTAAATVSGINIDKTPPGVSVTGVSNGATYALGSVPVTGCTTTDSLSGVATNATPSVSGGNPNGTGSFTATCSGATDVAGNAGGASVAYSVNVVYTFSGFFQPVDNLPALNSVKAGQAIPVKFSLGGNQGLNILATGSPASQQITCDNGSPLDDIEETVSAGNSSLSYDASADQYKYVWKTNKAWAGTCRQFVLALNDGTTHIANFKFK